MKGAGLRPYRRASCLSCKGDFSMKNKNSELAVEAPDAELARTLQRFWPHRVHESGTLRNLCCLLGFHLWAQPDYSAFASRRDIRFCCWCASVEIDGTRSS